MWWGSVGKGLMAVDTNEKQVGKGLIKVSTGWIKDKPGFVEWIKMERG